MIEADADADTDIELDIQEATSLLTHSPTFTTPPPRRKHNAMARGNMTTKGMLRAYWLGTCVCMAGFLFGYDSGIIGKPISRARPCQAIPF